MFKFRAVVLEVAGFNQQQPSFSPAVHHTSRP
jgi:hypothetical protein